MTPSKRLESELVQLKQPAQWRGPLLMVSAWVLFAFVQFAVQAISMHRTVQLIRIGSFQLFTGIWWAALTPFIVDVARRYDLTRSWRNLPAHLLTLAIITPLDAFATFTAIRIIPGFNSSERFRFILAWNINFTISTYCAVIAISYAIWAYRRARASAQRAQTLESDLSRAQLEVLTLQLQPHFLFNTLHSISELVHLEVKAAREMIAHLQELLRVSFERASVQESALEDELSFLRAYVEIERMRFGDRLRFTLETSPDALGAAVPHLLLQPIVENSIRHGLARSRGGRIRLSAWRNADRLELEIVDDGCGLRGVPTREGHGLRTTRARLEQLYGGNAHLTLDDAPGGGTAVRLTVPYRAFVQPAKRDRSAPSPETTTQPQMRTWSIARTVAVTAIGTVLLACVLVQQEVWSLTAKSAPKMWHYIGLDLQDAAFWFPAALLVIAFARQLTLDTRVFLRTLLHFFLGIAIGLAHIELRRANGYFGPKISFLSVPAINSVLIDVTIYCMILCAVQVVRFFQRTAERENEAAILRARIARTELEALRWRLHPEFLNSVLNSISTVMQSDPETADEMTAELGDLLRIMLEAAHAEEVPLQRELDWIASFSRLAEAGPQHVRFTTEIDPDCLDVLVPNGILQAIVSDAVATSSTGPFSVCVRAKRTDDRVAIIVELPPEHHEDTVVLELARVAIARLRSGTRRVQLLDQPGSRALRVELPYRTEEANEMIAYSNAEFA